MPSFTIEERLAVPPKDAFALWTDIAGYPHWIPFTKEVVSIDETKARVGTVYVERGTGGKSTWTVVESKKNKREVHEGDIGIATMRIILELEKDGKGTLMRQTMAYEMKRGLLGKLIEKVAFARQLRKGSEETVANFKRLVES